MKKYLPVLFLLILLILGCFYWFEYRPSMIIKKCYEISNGKTSNLTSQENEFVPESFVNKYVPGFNQTTKEINYKNCLRDNGLEK